MSTTLSLRSRSSTPTPSRGSDPSRLGRICQPPFAPLLEETEVAGWSSHRDFLAGSFHDWRLLEDGRVLVSVAQVAATLPSDRLTLALAAQSAQTAIRAHALHTEDAGTLLQLAARTLGLGETDEHVSLAVALIDGVGGEVNLAIAGDCLAWRVRAARWEQLAQRSAAPRRRSKLCLHRSRVRPLAPRTANTGGRQLSPPLAALHLVALRKILAPRCRITPPHDRGRRAGDRAKPLRTRNDRRSTSIRQRSGGEEEINKESRRHIVAGKRANSPSRAAPRRRAAKRGRDLGR